MQLCDGFVTPSSVRLGSKRFPIHTSHPQWKATACLWSWYDSRQSRSKMFALTRGYEHSHHLLPSSISKTYRTDGCGFGDLTWRCEKCPSLVPDHVYTVNKEQNKKVCPIRPTRSKGKKKKKGDIWSSQCFYFCLLWNPILEGRTDLNGLDCGMGRSGQTAHLLTSKPKASQGGGQ